ncbi:MAG: dephospho-CoA kinase [Fimbriimonas sp.]|jgi:dephospho-CoA kinase|nr:dephospho-CoA kinase [Fimbriimonas sp.]
MRIAVTGGIAEGKSTLLKLLAGMGFQCASADAAARDIFFDPTVQADLAQLLSIQGEVSPALLRSMIAEDHHLRREINLLLHPQIINLLLRQNATFFEVPLLIETCLQSRFDAVWIAKCQPDTKLARLAERGIKEPSNQMFQVQFESEARLAFADCVFETDASIAETAEQLKKEVKSYGFSLVVSAE